MRSSILTVIYFAVFLLFFSFLSLGIFSIIENGGIGVIDSSDVYLPTPNATMWSPISDFIGVVIGLPVALAGSVVAIYLAHRAYEVSRIQARLDERAHVEALVTRSSEAFWSLSDAIRGYDTALNELVLASFNYDEKVQKYKPADGTISRANPEADRLESEAEDRLRIAKSRFREASSNASSKILLILRDPISSQAWNKASARCLHTINESISSSIDEGNEETISTIQNEIKKLTKDDEKIHPSAISQFFQDYQFLTERMSESSPSLPTRIILTQENARVKKQENGIAKITYRRRNPMETYPGENSEKVERSFSISDLENTVRNRTRIIERISSSPTLRLKVLGAYLSIYPASETKDFAHRKTGAKTWINSGALLLSIVLSSYPTKDDFSEAVKTVFSKDNDFQPTSHKTAERILSGMNIDAYLPSWTKQSATHLIKSPLEFIIVRSTSEAETSQST